MILIPTNVRRSSDDLYDRLDLSSGDAAAKRTAFWAMLALSGLIAAAGVVIDSTATVIGAMIIAPLSTPILGVAFGVVTASGGMVKRSLRYVVNGAVVVVVIGAGVVLVTPDAADIVTSSQVTSRTFPTIGDLAAAIATGLAGSIAIVRKDLGAALPGVAIAISLVPPLVVAGVCLGSGEMFLALGALILFLSNVAALIAACTVVLRLSGYRASVRGSGRAYLAVAAFLVVVAIPIAINTAVLILASRWAEEVREAAVAWVGQKPGTEVESVEWQGRTIVLTIRSPDELPPISDLKKAVYQQLPPIAEVSVVHTQGSRVELRA